MPDIPRTAADVLSTTGIAASELRDVMPRVDPSHVRVRVARGAFVRTWAKGIRAVTTPWAVYFHPEVMDRYARGEDLEKIGLLMVHELMHVEQLARLGVVPHSTQYVRDYLRGRLSGASHWDAYRDIALETEARAATRLVAARRR